MKYSALFIFAFTSIMSAFSQGPETEICLVTVDETFTYNKIIWEESSQVSTTPIDSIFIYRQNFLGSYDLIGKVEYTGNGEFSDLVANPNTQAYSYRIQGKDENGVVGPLSDQASTIHLSLVEDLQNNSMTLNWTSYVGVASFSFYQCWELDIPSNTKVNINNTNNMTTTSWTYTGLSIGTIYDIVVDTDENTTTCASSTRANYNNTRSNRSSISFGGGTASVDEKQLKNLKLYPNPADKNLIIDFSSSAKEKIDIKIYDLSGKVVYQHQPLMTMGSVSVELNIHHLESGIYTVVIDNGYRATKKLTVN